MSIITPAGMPQIPQSFSVGSASAAKPQAAAAAPAPAPQQAPAAPADKVEISSTPLPPTPPKGSADIDEAASQSEGYIKAWCDAGKPRNDDWVGTVAVQPYLSSIMSHANSSDYTPDAPVAKAPVLGGGDFATASMGGLAVSSAAASGPKRPSMEMVEGFRTITDAEAKQLYSMDRVGDRMSDVQRSCVKAYCTFAYRAMNGYLFNPDKTPADVAQAAQTVQKALGSGNVPSGVVLSRTTNIQELHNYLTNDQFSTFEQIYRSGGDSSVEDAAAWLKGTVTDREIPRKTFVSSTIDGDFSFDPGAEVVTRFYVGDGVGGVYVTADERLSQFPEEKECLLTPGAKMTVMDVGVEEQAQQAPDGSTTTKKLIVLHVFAGDVPEGGLAVDALALGSQEGK